ncbi:hypothetical protein cje25_09474 [Campylobacter jejuni subsp. jejuni 1997-14]|nr:hypothetical protein cje25_09474 [Campylobacter jejuni subsp. jejuni 1997-14]
MICKAVLYSGAALKYKISKEISIPKPPSQILNDNSILLEQNHI